jgi:hypothetical protein
VRRTKKESFEIIQLRTNVIFSLVSHIIYLIFQWFCIDYISLMCSLVTSTKNQADSSLFWSLDWVRMKRFLDPVKIQAFVPTFSRACYEFWLKARCSRECLKTSAWIQTTIFLLYLIWISSPDYAGHLLLIFLLCGVGLCERWNGERAEWLRGPHNGDHLRTKPSQLC